VGYKNSLHGLIYEREEMNEEDEHDNVLNELLANKMNLINQLMNE
jgi:hypothetical protein